MFSIFKKRPKVLDSYINNFPKYITEEQKKSILHSLYGIANSDGEFHKKEMQFMTRISNIINYKLTDETVYKVIEMNKSSVRNNMNSLAKEQKDWYIAAAFYMIHVDGKALEEEWKEFTSNIMYDLEISMDHYKELMVKIEAMLKASH